MPVPAALTSSLGTLAPTLERVATYMVGRVSTELAALQPVTVVHRIKSPDSVYHKLQTGRYSSLSDLDDLVGIKVVLLRRCLLGDAQSIITDCGLTVVPVPVRVVDPADFRYREPKLFVRPPPAYVERNPETELVVTEVQFTTALQHALDVATHGFDYKGTTYSWGNFRLVAQLRGTLELVDRILDDIAGASILSEMDAPAPDRYGKAEVVLGTITGVFDVDVLPEDRRRMTDTVLDWIEAADVAPDDLAALLGRHADLTSALSIDPTAAVLGCLLREKSAELFAGYERFLPITPELLSLCPGIPNVAADRCVAFR